MQGNPHYLTFGALFMATLNCVSKCLASVYCGLSEGLLGISPNVMDGLMLLLLRDLYTISS